jgi:cytochrome b pre-mRNA-processing protein 3
MISRWFRPTSADPIIAALYGAIVAQARRPAFYRLYRVPDTVTGRLEMIIVHLDLVLQRLRDESVELRVLGQRLFDRFCTDMDDNMREMGVGDLAVPRKMRRIADAFYDRQRAYRIGFEAADDEQLAAALGRNVFAGEVGTGQAKRLAAYARLAASHLVAQNGFARGTLTFPDPECVLVAGF